MVQGFRGFEVLFGSGAFSVEKGLMTSGWFGGSLASETEP